MKNKILKKIVAVIAAVAMVAGVIYVLPANDAKAANAVNVTVSGEGAVAMANAANGTMNLYMWGGCKNEWPGTAMTKVEDGVWQVTNIIATGDMSFIVTNKNVGSVQTADITGVKVDKKDIYITIAADNSVKVTYGTESAPEATTKENTYNVAGEAGLCGVAWDPAANQMTNNGDGTWTKEFADIAIGTYEFKVCLNGMWGTEYNLDGLAVGGAANATVTVEEDGSTVIVGFDGSKVTVSVVVHELETTTKEEDTTNK